MTDITTPKDHIILVPLDFSDTSLNAVYYAVKMANLFDDEITLLHVISKSKLQALFMNDSEVALLRDKIKDEYCEKNGIKLIRIPYTMKKEEIEPYILKELGIK